jgi:hypothetical protein
LNVSILPSLLAGSVAAEAQPAGGVRGIGFLWAPPEPLTDSWRAAFVSGLSEHGGTEGENMAFEGRYPAGASGRTPPQEPFRAKAEVAVGEHAHRAAGPGHQTLPIVMRVPAAWPARGARATSPGSASS